MTSSFLNADLIRLKDKKFGRKKNNIEISPIKLKNEKLEQKNERQILRRKTKILNWNNKNNEITTFGGRKSGERFTEFEQLILPEIRSTPENETNQLSKLSSRNNICTTQNTSQLKIRYDLFSRLRPSTKSILWKIYNTDEPKSLQTLKFGILKNKLEKLISTKLEKEGEKYDKTILNNIIKNKNTHITSIFKDFLVYDEPIEFLQKEFSLKEGKEKLNKLTEFHNVYFKVFPNYIVLPEKSYMYKNIERKQRVIDDKQYWKMVNIHKKKFSFIKQKSHSKLFTESYMNNISNFKDNFEKED